MYGVQSAAHNSLSPVQLLGFQSLGAFLWSSRGVALTLAPLPFELFLTLTRAAVRSKSTCTCYTVQFSFHLHWTLFTNIVYIYIYISLCMLSTYINDKCVKGSSLHIPAWWQRSCSYGISVSSWHWHRMSCSWSAMGLQMSPACFYGSNIAHSDEDWQNIQTLRTVTWWHKLPPPKSSTNEECFSKWRMMTETSFNPNGIQRLVAVNSSGRSIFCPSTVACMGHRPQQSLLRLGGYFEETY